jgi:hypothetical protein
MRWPDIVVRPQKLGYDPRWFSGELLKQEGLAGGEDYGYFASNAGDAGSNPAAGICARVV